MRQYSDSNAGAIDSLQTALETGSIFFNFFMTPFLARLLLIARYDATN